MADTIKKKLTIKSSRASAPAEGGAESETLSDVLPPEASGAPVPINPFILANAAKPPSYTLYAILGLLACLMFLVLLLIQWMEFSYYAQPPSLWPVR